MATIVFITPTSPPYCIGHKTLEQLAFQYPNLSDIDMVIAIDNVRHYSRKANEVNIRLLIRFSYLESVPNSMVTVGIDSDNPSLQRSLYYEAEQIAKMASVSTASGIENFWTRTYFSKLELSDLISHQNSDISVSALMNIDILSRVLS